MLEGIFLQYVLNLLEFLEVNLTILWEPPLTELPYNLSVLSLQQFFKCGSESPSWRGKVPGFLQPWENKVQGPVGTPRLGDEVGDLPDQLPTPPQPLSPASLSWPSEAISPREGVESSASIPKELQPLSVQSLSCVQLFATPWTAAFTISLNLL